MDWAAIISQVGFPIACCGAMAWYVKYITDQHIAERNELNKQHREAEQNILEAIQNNTIVMMRICERLGEKNENI